MTSYPETLTVRKVDQDEVFAINIIAFLLRMTQILHKPKIVLWVMLMRKHFMR